MRAEMIHAGGRKDGQTYMTRLTFAFRNFEKAPKKVRKILVRMCKWKGHLEDLWRVKE